MKKYDALVQLLYQTVDDHQVWPEFSHHLDQFIGAQKGFLSLRSKKTNAVLDVFKWGIDDDAFSAYTEHYYSVDIWSAALVKQERGRFHASHNITPDRDFLKSEIHAGFARPSDIRHGCGAIFDIPLTDQYVQLVSLRENGQSHYQHDEVRKLNRLIPHLQQSLYLRQKILSLKSATEISMTLIEHTNNAVCICDGYGRILEQNTQAEQLIQSSPLLESKSNYLRLTHPDKMHQLQALQREAVNAAGGEDCSPGGSLRVETEIAGVDFIVLPFRYNSTTAVIENIKPSCLVVMEDSSQANIPSIAILQETYGLTHSEAKITRLLAASTLPKEIAQFRQSSLATVRTQIREIYQKLNVNNQLMLSKKLCSGLIMKM